MKFLKGDITTAKKKSNRVIVRTISQHSDLIPGKKNPGDVILYDGIYYMITQYIEGEPRHYDTEEVRVELFKQCLVKLFTMINATEIAIPHMMGSHTKDQWKIRKDLFKAIEDGKGIEILIFVPESD